MGSTRAVGGGTALDEARRRRRQKRDVFSRGGVQVTSPGLAPLAMAGRRPGVGLAVWRFGVQRMLRYACGALIDPLHSGDAASCSIWLLQRGHGARRYCPHCLAASLPSSFLPHPHIAAHAYTAVGQPAAVLRVYLAPSRARAPRDPD